MELSAEQIARLNNPTPAAGERHDKGNMAVVDRLPHRASRSTERRARSRATYPALILLRLLYR
jgi:hypothetical protein